MSHTDDFITFLNGSLSAHTEEMLKTEHVHGRKPMRTSTFCSAQGKWIAVSDEKINDEE